MKNLLIVGANQDTVDATVIDEVRKKADIDKMFFIISKRDEVDIYEKYGRCFFREDVAKGQYDEKEIDMTCCVPLDDSVFRYMAPYVTEILIQQRRFEEYHAFHISNSFESHYTIYMRNLFFWNNLLEIEQITHVFLSCLPHEGYDSIIYHLCKQKGIPIRMFYNSTLPHRYYALSDYMNPNENLGDYYSYLLKKYADKDNVPLNDEEKSFYKKWSSKDPEMMKPWYMKNDPLKRRFSLRFGCTNIFEAWWHVLGRIYVRYDYKMCGAFIFDCIKNIPQFVKAGIETFQRWRYGRPVWKRTIQLNRFYEDIAELPVEGERYIYFAMHYQPEASSNPLGGREYADQILAINLLARSIPSDMKIYVKAHPEQLAPLRSREYYQDIKRIANVRIIKLSCNTYDLIRKAFAVSSLTGTACWEAQFFGIPAILFGYSHKNLAPLSYHVRTYEECCNAVKDIIRGRRRTTERELKLLIKAMYDLSFNQQDWKKEAIITIEELVNE